MLTAIGVFCKGITKFIKLFMTKAEIVARLGKKARAVNVPENQFGIVKVLFYTLLGENGGFNYLWSTIAVDFFNAAGDKVGNALLNIHLFQRNYIRISKIQIMERKFDVTEDLSCRKNNVTPNYEMKNEAGFEEETDFSKEVYAFLAECYRLFVQLVHETIAYEPEVNPAAYAWIVSRGHLTE